MAGFWETYYEAQKRINQNQQDVYDAHKDPEVLKGIARTALDSATIVGAGGEIEAGIRAPFSDQTFQEIDSQINQEQAAFKENNPDLYQGYSVVGMAPTLAVGAPAAVAAKIGSKFIPNVLAMGTAGLGYGALEGLFRGENPEERVDMSIEEAPKMAAGGAVLGAALLGAIKVSPPVIRFFGSMINKVMGR